MLIDVSQRRRRPERMDQPGIDRREHELALRGLGRVNIVSRSVTILWPHIARLARRDGEQPIRVLDIASGGGDVPLALARRAARARLPIQIAGCDVSPLAVEFAQRRAERENADVRFFPIDVLDQPMPTGYDVLTCSLFLHHLDDADAVRLLRRTFEAANQLLLVDDLIRSRTGYLMAWLGCRLLSRSAIVHFDGPVSVAGAFTPSEALSLAEQAGLSAATVTRHWPQRYLLVCEKP